MISHTCGAWDGAADAPVGSGAFGLSEALDIVVGARFVAAVGAVATLGTRVGSGAANSISLQDY